MSKGRKELLNLLSSNQPVSIYFWITLLNFFERNKDDLDLIDMRLLVSECEEIRTILNKDLDLNIEPEDTNPNIYTHLELLEKQEHKRLALEIENNKESLSTDDKQLVAIAQ